MSKYTPTPCYTVLAPVPPSFNCCSDLQAASEDEVGTAMLTRQIAYYATVGDEPVSCTVCTGWDSVAKQPTFISYDIHLEVNQAYIAPNE